MASVEKMKELLGATETVLELVQLPSGELALRSVGSQEDPLLTIKFSDKAQVALGDNTQQVAQHMIQSALYMIMEQQAARWHAQVMDEEPKHFS